MKYFIDNIPYRGYILTMKNPIGPKIKELRKNAKLTQVEFARRAGVGLRFVRELEQGKASVRMDKVDQVLEFFGCHLEIARNEKQ